MRLISRLAHKILTDGFEFDMILAVARGGLIPATRLSHIFHVPRVDVIALASYTGTISGPISFGQCPPHDTLHRRRILLVDDILETGNTIRSALSYCCETDCIVRVATLVRKRMPEVDVRYQFNAITVDPSKWVVFPWEA